MVAPHNPIFRSLKSLLCEREDVVGITSTPSVSMYYSHSPLFLIYRSAYWEYCNLFSLQHLSGCSPVRCSQTVSSISASALSTSYGDKDSPSFAIAFITSRMQAGSFASCSLHRIRRRSFSLLGVEWVVKLHSCRRVVHSERFPCRSILYLFHSGPFCSTLPWEHYPSRYCLRSSCAQALTKQTNTASRTTATSVSRAKNAQYYLFSVIEHSHCNCARTLLACSVLSLLCLSKALIRILLLQVGVMKSCIL